VTGALVLRQGPQSILVLLGDARSGFHGFFKVRIIRADFEPFRSFPDKDFIAFLGDGTGSPVLLEW
jgi:hypothetical protein